MTPPDAVLDGDTGTARFVEQRTVDPADLDPYPGNPNVGDVDEIRVSLRANGQYRTPVTRLMPDGRLTVLAGHATRLAAIAEGLPLRVDVIEVDDATARRIVAGDNRLPQLAHYDQDALLLLLDAVAADDGGLAGTGWSAAARDDLATLLQAPDLDELAGVVGGPTDTDRHVVVRLSVDPEVRDRLERLMALTQEPEEADAFAGVIAWASTAASGEGLDVEP